VAGARILFDDVPAPLIYVSARQSAAVAPYSVDGHATTSVVVEYNGLKSAPLIVPVVAARPGLFSADSSGSGQGAILNQDYKYNSADIPAPRGTYVSLYGTGEGQTIPAGIDGSVAVSVLPKPVLPVKVTLGGTPIDPLQYAGAAPSSIAGLFQINIRIPCDAPLGNVPVVVDIGGVKSQAGLTVAISDAPGCVP
jgi:uncharacterized protein (TIGR03437 family)